MHVSTDGGSDVSELWGQALTAKTREPRTRDAGLTKDSHQILAQALVVWVDPPGHHSRAVTTIRLSAVYLAGCTDVHASWQRLHFFRTKFEKEKYMSKKKNLVQHTVPRKKKNDAKFVRIFGTNHIPISVGSCRALVEWMKARLKGPEGPLLKLTRSRRTPTAVMAHPRKTLPIFAGKMRLRSSKVVYFL